MSTERRLTALVLFIAISTGFSADALLFSTILAAMMYLVVLVDRLTHKL